MKDSKKAQMTGTLVRIVVVIGVLVILALSIVMIIRKLGKEGTDVVDSSVNFASITLMPYILRMIK